LASGGVFNGIGNIAGIVTPLVIGYVVTVTGSFNNALWFVAAHGVLAVVSYLLIATRFERVDAAKKKRRLETAAAGLDAATPQIVLVGVFDFHADDIARFHFRFPFR
jgi:hypothetical protein